MKIIVTGATGFIGPSVANAIVDAGHEVRVLERKAGSWSKARIRARRWTPIMGEGAQKIQPIWIDDLAGYFAAGVDKPEAANRVFELGGPDQVSWNEFWERLKKAVGLRRPSVHMPMAFLRLNALVTERLPGNIPLTRDLLRMLEAGDNVVTTDDGVATFQLPLVPLDEQLRRTAV